MFPEPTELLWIGCSIGSIWPPKSESNTLTPKTNSQTYWPREISHVKNGNHLLCLFYISHFSSITCLEVMSKRTQEDAGEERVTAQSEPMMNLFSDAAWGILRCRLYCIRKPGDTRYESQTRLFSWERTDLGWRLHLVSFCTAVLMPWIQGWRYRPVARRIGLLTDGIVDFCMFETQVVQHNTKLHAQFLRLFSLHDAVNDAHRASANRLQNKHIWITNFRGVSWKKTTILGKSAYLFVVLRNGRSC